MTLERLLATAREDPDVLAVVLYGSRARGDAGPGSDTDVCLVLRDAFPREELPRRALDYLGFDLDLRIVQALPLPLRRRVLFVRDEGALYDLEAVAAGPSSPLAGEERGEGVDDAEETA